MNVSQKILVACFLSFAAYMLIRALVPDKHNVELQGNVNILITDDWVIHPFYKGSKPFLPVEINGIALGALVDSGSTRDQVDLKWLHLNGINASESDSDVRTIAGDKVNNKLFRLDSLNVLEKDLKAPLVGARSGAVPTIGNISLAKLTPFVLTKKAIKVPRNDSVKPAQETCRGISDDVDDRGQIFATYVPIVIDGTQEFAYLDTGFDGVIAGTSLINKHCDNCTSLRGATLFRTNAGMSVQPYFNKKSIVQVGNAELVINHPVYSGWTSTRAKYVIGWGFFDYFSLYIDYDKRLTCWLSADN